MQFSIYTTIWECYSPTEDLPSTDKVEKWSRTDFCGWSALGPISLFIENILGVREINALTQTLIWDPKSTARSGIRNLKMAGKSISLICDPVAGQLNVDSEVPFTLIFNGTAYPIPVGKTVKSVR